MTEQVVIKRKASFTDFLKWCIEQDYTKEIPMGNNNTGVSILVPMVMEYMQTATRDGVSVKWLREKSTNFINDNYGSGYGRPGGFSTDFMRIVLGQPDPVASSLGTHGTLMPNKFFAIQVFICNNFGPAVRS